MRQPFRIRGKVKQIDLFCSAKSSSGRSVPDLD